MKLQLPRSPGRLALSLVFFLSLLTLAVLLFAYSGLYNIAASSGHLVAVKTLLEFGMHRSVVTWSNGVPTAPRDLDSPLRIQLGASHFSAGCASCHGAPGKAVNAVHDRMLPPPPRLQGVVQDWTPRQLFWIVRHGIKYTGMPYWSGAGRDDEVWSVVAFLLHLPRLDEAAYQRYVTGNSRKQAIRTAQAVASGHATDHLTTCDRCHDTSHAGPASALVPRLAGQTEDYLAQSLRDYSLDLRQSGIMEPVATALDEGDMRELARYYSSLVSPRYAGTPGSRQQLDRGRRLAQFGDAPLQVPACHDCHAETSLLRYPRLAAQSAPYIEAQLAMWQQGGRAQTPTGRLMAVIAKRMTPGQIRDVASYYQQLPQPTGTQATR